MAALPSRRIESIDMVRGVALLGILVLNVQTFAMPFEAYTDPTAFGDLSGINGWVSYLTGLLGDQKFMSIFSMLFGAGIILLTERLEATGRSAIGVHYRRMGWLLVIGMFHAYVIWYGDILVSYAICGAWVVWLRRWRPVWQLAIGLAVVSVSSLLMIVLGLLILTMPPEAYAQAVEDQIGPDSIPMQVSIYQSGWLTQMSHRPGMAAYFQTVSFLFYSLWRASGLMLVGMALYRWGVFSAACRVRTYAILLGLALVVGIPMVWWGFELKLRSDYDPIRSEFFYVQFNYWGSILVALGYVSIVMLAVKAGVLTWFQSALACVGRMALTNYLAQSLVCSLIFYGHGLGYFGRTERVDQILIVLAISVLQLVWSPLWLAVFRFGPMEWLWRSLTYLRWQPLRR